MKSEAARKASPPSPAETAPFPHTSPVSTPRTRVGRSNGRPAPVLDLDPGLARQVPAGELALARCAAVAATLSLRRGRWIADTLEPDPAHLGYLVLGGVLSRELHVDGGRSVELLGAGDVVRPWQEDSSSFCGSRHHALVASRLAVLDAQFAERIARWPQLTAALLGRALQRSRSQAAISAIGHVVGLEQRLAMLFWHLAERWGRVSAGAVSIELPLTHRMLADLVGAQRPSVTTALGKLASAGELTRRDGVWTLHGDPPRAIGADPTRRTHAAAP